MAYELFQNKAVKFGSPHLTIRGGRISFNADAGDILARVGMRFAHILWDPDGHRLAIRPTARQDESAFRVSIPKGKRGGSFSAHSFLKYIHWNDNGPVVVNAEWNEGERLLEATLPSEHIATLETRKTKTRQAGRESRAHRGPGSD